MIFNVYFFNYLTQILVLLNVSDNRNISFHISSSFPFCFSSSGWTQGLLCAQQSTHHRAMPPAPSIFSQSNQHLPCTGTPRMSTRILVGMKEHFINSVIFMIMPSSEMRGTSTGWLNNSLKLLLDYSQIEEMKRFHELHLEKDVRSLRFCLLI